MAIQGIQRNRIQMGIQRYRIQGIQRNRIQMGIQRGIQEDTWGYMIEDTGVKQEGTRGYKRIQDDTGR